MKLRQPPKPMHPVHAHAYELALAKLHVACRILGLAERSIIGADAIAEYLSGELGMRTQKGTAISKPTLGQWIKKYNFPASAVGRSRNGLLTTNLLIFAWLWSFREMKRNAPKRPASMRIER